MAYDTPSRPFRPAPHPPVSLDGSPRSPGASPTAAGLRGCDADAPLAQALQLDISRSRLAAQHADNQKMRRDLEQAREKALSLGIKLNEERMQKVALTHRYTAVVGRVRDIDERMREAEEVMQAERRQQRELQRTVDLLRDQVQQKQAIIDSQAGMLSKQQAGINTRESGLREEAERREGQQARVRDAAARCVDHCGVLLAGAVERLGRDRESKGAAVTVLCSEVATTVTETQQGLQRAELRHGAALELLAAARAAEEEYSGALAAALHENKELWAQLDQKKAEMQRLGDERRRRGHAELQEQADALAAEKLRAEEQLRGTKGALAKHIRAAEEHERNFARAIDDLHAAEGERGRLAEANAELQRSAQAVEQQLAAAQRGLDDAEHGADAQRRAAAALQVELAAERERARGAAAAAAADAAALREAHDAERRRAEAELRGATERAAGAAAERDRLQGDVLRLQQAGDAARAALDDERAAQAAALRDDLAVQKAMYEREVDGLRRDVSARDAEIAELQQASDRDRLDATSLRMELGATRARAEELRREGESLHAEARRLADERQAQERELDERRSAVAELAAAAAEHDRERARAEAAAEGERRRHADERHALEAQAAQAAARAEEAEARRADAERELRAAAAERERSGGARAREEWERDRALLVAENERVLAQYAGASEQNTLLLGEQRRLQERAAAEAQLRDEVAVLRRQAAQQAAAAGELHDARGALARAEEEIGEMRRERDATQQRLDRLLDESKRKDIDLDLPACVEAADQQIRRLEQQMEAASFYTARRRSPVNRSPPGGSARTAVSPPSAAARARGGGTPARPAY